jgi:PST family polysaccharide transporter
VAKSQTKLGGCDTSESNDPTSGEEESPQVTAQSQDSYTQILRSSTITGGAQAINYLVSLIKAKMVATLLGPSGIGVVGLYVSAMGLMGTLASLGIGQSGVRQVADAHGSGNPELVAGTIKTLRRICWFTGALGWLLTVALSYPLSCWTFGSGEHATAIAILGGGLLLGAIHNSQTAILRGVRRIGDIARLGVLSTVVGTLVAVALYAWLSEEGIVPVMLTTAFLNVACAWWFSRRVVLVPVRQSWKETLQIAKVLLSLGVAFTWAALLSDGVALAIRSITVREFGIVGSGIYQAAWSLSGVFGGFVIGAMGADFYPRLTAVSNDHTQVNRLVNEQTVIGVLLALPGLIASIAFAPWILHLFYSIEFVAGAELLRWFALGIFGRVVSFPMGYILLAKGSSRWFAVTETCFSVLLLCLTLTLIKFCGLIGTAYAFAMLYGLHCLAMALLARHLTGLHWERQTLHVLGTAGVLIVGVLVLQNVLPEHAGYVGAAFLTFLSAVVSFRGIVTRLGADHHIVRSLCRIPAGNWVCGLSTHKSNKTS